MTVTIYKAAYNQAAAARRLGIVVYLSPKNWDDFGYKTLFNLTIEEPDGNRRSIGDLKIGYIGQPKDSSTRTALQDGLLSLPETFFSLGQDADYYEKLSHLSESLRNEVLSALRDVVYETEAMKMACETAGDDVFYTSLLRSLELTSVQDQFSRVLRGGALLTPFHFGYKLDESPNKAGVALEFTVRPGSRPSTNIHVLIGRNGIGKTTLLNNMISCLVDEPVSHTEVGNFYDLQKSGSPVNNNYFTSIISTAFSAFDPFTPPADRTAEDGSIRYTYIGLKEVRVGDGKRTARHKDINDLTEDFLRSFASCMSLEKKRERWLDAIKCLSADSNFSEMQLDGLSLISDPDERELVARRFFSKKMSSGHALVLLTLTKLVERTEEKTLVLMDEPESHLHPPLLSAFIRALSLLLNDRNGVAIIATHSPVILQEVPKNCVWKIRRTRLEMRADRPDEETFGENVGILTRDVFGLEVAQSGFHDVLYREVEAGKSFDQIVSEFRGQIGFEGKAVLRALIRNRGPHV